MSLILFGDAVQKTAAAIETLEGQLDALIQRDAPQAFAVLADLAKGLAENKISLGEFVQEVTKLQTLNASGWLGDLNKLILETTRAVNALNGGIEELQQGAGEMDWGGPGTGAGQERADDGPGAGAGIGGSGGGAAGATSTGGGGGPNSTAGMTLFNEGAGARGLVASNIHVSSIGVTRQDRARILRELKDRARRLRR